MSVAHYGLGINPLCLITILETLRDPANAPYCANMYLITLKIAATTVQDALKEKDTQFFKLAVVFIKFLAIPFQEPEVYAAVRERLFREDCDCARLYPEFHQMCREEGRSLQGFKMPEDLDSFFGSTCEYVDYILSRIKQPSINTISDIWPRRLADVVEKRAGSLVASMTFWLSRNNGLQVLKAFSTIIEFSWVGIGSAIHSSAAFWVSFDECLHRLVSMQYTVLPGEHQPIDEVFRGVAGVAHAACCAPAFGTKTRPYSLNAKGRYTDICRLLSMKPLSGNGVRNGRVLGLFALATFAEVLRELCPGEQLSRHVHPILKDIDRIPKAYHWLRVCFAARDCCHNWRRHSSGRTTSLEARARRHSLVIKERVRHDKRLQACSGCRAVHYCSRECQREDWCSGSPSHKTLCPTLQKLFDLHDKGSHKPRPFADIVQMYDSLDIPKSDIEMAAEHAEKMFQYFSEYNA